jgi:hypothetical protein
MCADAHKKIPPLERDGFSKDPRYHPCSPLLFREHSVGRCHVPTPLTVGFRHLLAGHALAGSVAQEGYSPGAYLSAFTVSDSLEVASPTTRLRHSLPNNGSRGAWVRQETEVETSAESWSFTPTSTVVTTTRSSYLKRGHEATNVAVRPSELQK